SSFRSLASRRSTLSSPPYIWPEETSHVEGNSSGAGHGHWINRDHRTRLPVGHDWYRRNALSLSGARKPDREGWEGHRICLDRSGVQGRWVLPWSAVGDYGYRPERLDQDRPLAI